MVVILESICQSTKALNNWTVTAFCFCYKHHNSKVYLKKRISVKQALTILTSH